MKDAPGRSPEETKMYSFVRVGVRGPERFFDDVKSAFEGIGPTDRVLVVWSGFRFVVLRP